MPHQKKIRTFTNWKSNDTYSSGEPYHRFYFDRLMIDNDMSLPLFPFVFMDNAMYGKQWCHHHNYPHVAVELILEGIVEYVTVKGSIKATPGDIFLIVPGSCVKIINTKDKSQKRKMVLIIGGNAPLLLCETMGFTGDTLIKTADSSRFKEMLTGIFEAMSKNEKREKLSQLAYTLLTELATEHRRDGIKLSNNMKRLKNYLSQHFNQPLTIEDMANFCGCSKSTLIRHFKESFGTTPFNFINSLRMERARSMLVENDLPIKEIAFQCGFSTASHFGVIFRKFHSISPAACRRNHKIANARSAIQKK
ncbi:MAG: helix-turn-helix transcriptional regulator [Lentisphaeria bacterium]|nr:helix-turn-helix transcriptional regulator [Lentisphaeria bacterium]